MTDRNPSHMALTVESARLALRTAGPHSGLYGEAAACMDGKLIEARDYLNEIAERRNARIAQANRERTEARG